MARRVPVSDGCGEGVTLRVGERCAGRRRCQNGSGRFAYGGVLSTSLRRSMALRIHEHYAPGRSIETNEYGSALSNAVAG